MPPSICRMESMEPLIDSHCHLDLPAFDTDRRQVIANARRRGVVAFVVPGTTAAAWPRLLELCRTEQGLYPALGLHPYFLADHRPQHLEALRLLAMEARPVAIGEIGLDFQLSNLDRKAQQALFRAQLRLAAELSLPVILHVRKAHDAVLKALEEIPVPGGICHAFNGSLQQAERYMKLGFLFGFGGMVTYARSRRLHRLSCGLPLSHLVLETDAPDMSGVRHRGRRNSPEYLPEILRAVARLRGLSQEEVARATTTNLCRCLRLSPPPLPEG